MKSLDVIIEIIKQILFALKFCHEKGYAHKSIDPDHIMIVKLEKINSILIKIIGFGSSMRLGAKIISNQFISQNALFVAPENNNSKSADKQDIWGCGILLLSLLTG
jgi:serine/threonine protein kinase